MTSASSLASILNKKYERKKRKLEAFSPRKSNGTCRKRTKYNQQNESRGKSEMKMDRQKTSDGARKNVNHSYGTRLHAKRKCEIKFSHEENDGFRKKRKTSEFSKEENGKQKRRKHVETYDKDIRYRHGDKTETDINERKRKRKSFEFLNKVDARAKGKRNCVDNNQKDNLKNPHERYKMNEEHSLTATNDKIVFKENENLANTSLFDNMYGNESIQLMEMANNFLDTNMKEYMHQIESETFGEDQNVVTRNVFQNQILEQFGNNFNSSYYFLELTSHQEDIGNYNQQTYEPQFPYKHSYLERADINMNKTFLILQQLDDIDTINISLCNEQFVAFDSDIYQAQSCIYPSIQDLKIEVGHYEDNDHPSQDLKIEVGHYEDNDHTSQDVKIEVGHYEDNDHTSQDLRIEVGHYEDNDHPSQDLKIEVGHYEDSDHPSQDLKIEVGHYEDNDHPSQDLKIEVGHYEDNDHPSQDLKIEVGHYEDNDHPSQANPTAMCSYIESMDTSVTCTMVTVKQEPVWDDYGKGTTDCTEDNENENDSEDIDTSGSIRSELRIRPIERRKRVKVPLRIRLLKNQTMRKAWKENTTCCLKYCWVDWPIVTVGQI
ncbi:hypothetical protein CHS0354_014597 [Potamilus streckersoni]|uniref:Uncharacterized protein n=1 Tax=Potamilus streckersoni TaxID=2493646 RepID=A0AAE0VHD2_9BIVA|nr:hypothetical protein CHS0354_014597 [Potamilus streckersoni]